MSAAVNRGRQTVRNFNEVCPPGTTVTYQGEPHVTESWAGLMGKSSEAGVFVSGIETPVPVSMVDVPGFVHGTGRYNKLED